MKNTAGKTRFRFTILVTFTDDQPIVRRTDEVVTAWDWHAYFTKKYPTATVEVIDHKDGE